MKAYMYQAALHCEACALDIMDHLSPDCGICGGSHPANLGLDCRAYRIMDNGRSIPADEAMYDSDRFPKGPYADGGGEADTPQHCDACQTFLENPLTDDGREYVKRSLDVFMVDNSDQSWEDIARAAEACGKPALATWARFYFAYGQ